MYEIRAYEMKFREAEPITRSLQAKTLHVMTQHRPAPELKNVDEQST